MEIPQGAGGLNGFEVGHICWNQTIWGRTPSIDNAPLSHLGPLVRLELLTQRLIHLRGFPGVSVKYVEQFSQSIPHPVPPWMTAVCWGRWDFGSLQENFNTGGTIQLSRRMPGRKH